MVPSIKVTQRCPCDLGDKIGLSLEHRRKGNQVGLYPFLWSLNLAIKAELGDPPFVSILYILATEVCQSGSWFLL